MHVYKKVFTLLHFDSYIFVIGTLIGGYADAPAHTVYFIVEADSIEKVGSFMLPILKLGTAEITAVTDLAEEVKKKLKEAKEIVS